MVWKISIKQLILKNHKISKEGKYPKERGKSPARARAHKERGHKEKKTKRKLKEKTKSAHKHLFFKHRQETQAA